MFPDKSIKLETYTYGRTKILEKPFKKSTNLFVDLLISKYLFLSLDQEQKFFSYIFIYIFNTTLLTHKGYLWWCNG